MGMTVLGVLASCLVTGLVLGALASRLAVGIPRWLAEQWGGPLDDPRLSQADTEPLGQADDQTAVVAQPGPDCVRKASGLTVVTAIVLCVACGARFGVTPSSAALAVFLCALLLLVRIDLRWHLLPDIVTLPLLWVGLLVNLKGAIVPLPQAVLGASVGYVFFWLVHHAFRLLARREGMGYGDFKLLAALGAWLGLWALPGLVLAAALLGVVGGLWQVWRGRTRWGQPLPFGPWLALAGALAVLVPGWVPGLAVLAQTGGAWY